MTTHQEKDHDYQANCPGGGQHSSHGVYGNGNDPTSQSEGQKPGVGQDITEITGHVIEASDPAYQLHEDVFLIPTLGKD